MATKKNDKLPNRLAQAGWRDDDFADFLGMSAEEAALVGMRVALSRQLKERRELTNVTQAELAQRMHSSQSRVAKIEGGDRSVSMDLLMRALLALGVSPDEIGRSIQSGGSRLPIGG